MELYIYAQEDGSIAGFSRFQPSGYNFPKLEISDEDIENFRANFFDYKYLNGELVKPQEQASKDQEQATKDDDGELQKQLAMQQQISAKTVQAVAMCVASINESQAQMQEIKKSNDQSTSSSQSPVDSKSLTSQSQSQSVSESGSNSESNSNTESGVTK
ncbi:hypothetical protein AYR59_04710 [Fructilactobacillus lindneri]|uniref:DUF2977 domain-containing protein n=1 Tax=Fructilactobacillus lindneri TaxID=53444 RepID=A0AB33BTT2_9LACO|nr:hypothetical protein [Fructilactobacillus lindneri]ANZ59355.1 hypothetical protein AYR59_04710 [Fructilactobacillus lindneri]